MCEKRFYDIEKNIKPNNNDNDHISDISDNNSMSDNNDDNICNEEKILNKMIN